MLRIVSFACLALFGAALFAGCSSDDKVTLSELGESCERTADCAKSLGCFGGTCRPADANVAVNTQQCQAIQCEAAADCCDETIFQPSASCSMYEEYCAESPTTYASYCALAAGPTCACNASQYACEENLCKRIECTTPADCCADFQAPSTCATYATLCASDATLYEYECTYSTGPNCVCDATTQACNNNICSSIETCATDVDCTFGVCSTAGSCVACEGDDDCFGSQKCLNNACITRECMTDVDCPAFSECQEDNTCKEVGCATDRECMAYMDSYLATCDKTASPVPTCSIACQTDAQCSTNSSPLRQCVSGRCTDPGCETDEECKILLSGSALMSLAGVRAVCLPAAP